MIIVGLITEELISCTFKVELKRFETNYLFEKWFEEYKETNKPMIGTNDNTNRIEGAKLIHSYFKEIEGVEYGYYVEKMIL